MTDDRMHGEVAKAPSAPELREIRADNGSGVSVTKQPEFAAFVTQEIKRRADVTLVSGATLD